MNEEVLRRALDEWTRGSSDVQARVRLFGRVRDMSYVYPASRDPVEVLKNGRGSGSGKHYLLAHLFRMLGLNVRNMMCTHRFNESPIGFPEEMQEILCKNEVVDIHDYLQIQVDGRWIDVDATWPVSLRDYGFPVNDEWDGMSPMLLSVVPDEVIVVKGNPERAKEDLLSKWTPRQRQLRRKFLEMLSAWVGELASDQPR